MIAPPHAATARPPGDARPGPDPDRAAFITMGAFSHTNAQLLAALERTLPGLSIERVDVLDLFYRSPRAMALSLIGVLREYGPGSLRSRARLRYRLFRTRAFFDLARALVHRRLAGRPLRFTLQTQSMFDASLPVTRGGADRVADRGADRGGGPGAVPHFVYTDHVAAARARAGWADGLGRPSRGWSACEREVYARATAVFTFGSKIRDLLVSDYGIDPARAIRVGAGATARPDHPPDTGLARYARRNILFVGIDWDRKGGPELAAAFARVRAVLPDATLTIVGCTPARDGGLAGPGVEILGRLPPAETARHFHAASVFCMPSRLEPFGIVFVEALHFALPIVATSVGDIGDIVRPGVNGAMVPPGDPDALAAALIGVLRDPLACQRCGQASLALAGDETWDGVARRMAAHVRPRIWGDTQASGTSSR